MNQDGAPPGLYVGRGIRRREDPRLLLGLGRYVADIRLPGQLEMFVLRSPHAHAALRSVDASAALAHPGVHAFLSHADIAGRVGDLPALDVRPDSKPAFQPALARARVRWVGEPVAVIIAEDRYVAEDAAELVRIGYDPLPPVLGIEEARAPGATLLYEEFSTNVVQVVSQSVGDVDAAFASADRTYRETFRVHRQAAAPMETRGVVAEAGPSGGVTLWTSTQFPHKVRALLAQALGLEEGAVRVVAPDVGGGFGVKEAVYCEELLAVHVSQRLGRPVRWVEDRREHFAGSCHAREQLHEVEAAVMNDGGIAGLRSRCWTSIGGAYGTLSNAPGLYVSAMLRGPYRIPCYSSEVLSVVTNKTPLNVYRGAGHPQAVFVMERLIELIARDLSVDPVELRLRNMLRPAEMPAERGVRLPSGEAVTYDSGDYPQCLRDAAALMDYGGFRAEQQRLRLERRHVGMGISFYIEGTGFGPYETAGIRVDPDGVFTLLTGSSPHGQGTATTHAQMVADELGVAPERIVVLHGDTGIVKDGIGTWGSRGAAVGGSAARIAAARLKDKARALAALMLGADGDGLVWEGGRIHPVGDAERGLSWNELAARAADGRGLPEGIDPVLSADVNFGVGGVAYAFAAHVAVVEVDVETGVVKVVRYGVAHDCGTVINPVIVAGQVVGGVAQGIGGTLFEEIVYDRSGRLLTQGLMDYLMPSVADIPDVRIIHRETPTPHNPYGIKGAGEGGTTGSTAALANAVADALLPFGVRLNDCGPFTPSRVLALLDGARGPRPPS
jgi:carbon-monoxide dehydrogenase large subunit